MVYKCYSLFKLGTDTTEDDWKEIITIIFATNSQASLGFSGLSSYFWPGHSIETTTLEILKKIEKHVLEDARLKWK